MIVAAAVSPSPAAGAPAAAAPRPAHPDAAVPAGGTQRSTTGPAAHARRRPARRDAADRGGGARRGRRQLRPPGRGRGGDAPRLRGPLPHLRGHTFGRSTVRRARPTSTPSRTCSTGCSTDGCFDGRAAWQSPGSPTAPGSPPAWPAHCRTASQRSCRSPPATGRSTRARSPRAPSFLAIHGSADTVVPYNGKRPDRAGSVPRYTARWARRDGCAVRPTADRVQRPRVTHLRYGGCDDGLRVELLRLSGPTTAGRAPGRRCPTTTRRVSARRASCCASRPPRDGPEPPRRRGILGCPQQEPGRDGLAASERTWEPLTMTLARAIPCAGLAPGAGGRRAARAAPAQAATPSSALSALRGMSIDGPSLAPARPGPFVARAGDVNGDGLDDVLVGTPEVAFGETQGPRPERRTSSSVGAARVELRSRTSTVSTAAAYASSRRPIGFLERRRRRATSTATASTTSCSARGERARAQRRRRFVVFGRRGGRHDRRRREARR